MPNLAKPSNIFLEFLAWFNSLNSSEMAVMNSRLILKLSQKKFLVFSSAKNMLLNSASQFTIKWTDFNMVFLLRTKWSNWILCGSFEIQGLIFVLTVVASGLMSNSFNLLKMHVYDLLRWLNCHISIKCELDSQLILYRCQRHRMFYLKPLDLLVWHTYSSMLKMNLLYMKK